ncbi:2-succinyl-5-enolpyruvyl-6-hydroxy-3-cyclohexene-1-carboxylic-acid synthase [Staphylococcus saprophyticus]|uniref:2-succinyl-5-enolpyruvyl-6-hydroxy-3- cyclohexene-1-carboxylic-acid synthase n=1 Tax=Staphylococcus saprophyticus TaxID=29385 RepID=UPI000853AD7A|nr:2-succinyl-5-enolpyruvyl-6-hydroxy-3-cyclohexene-1-carboxylic-acid synthase [Staphylococcus saprophyticus]MDW3865051.1 2-succinyl-5-enolpyruvyl-6-hydroxy-3-cyclohexene-1-carboxylic-acid synthase [Staphylococcus saprophyticus]MDW3895048.1 2-succinyl-5-enolpyruvyl-6-hydroxy-3-cyclohexene-1-carboxylic-acid synthase [Staphylococcus saprophyticus]MDW3897024.1 2-succinyl-5-enolpyruvyl-6-hydroxy-3-cyclohexene-1-carboxylic-acid synthase [Staphylococcus saprophyticus]MDW4039671.1 2-succinyl-5-enolpyr
MNNHTDALTKQVFTIVSELYAYGIREVVISPGSRSTPLAIAIEAHPKLKSWIHPDERSAAFFAMGLMKGSEKPVAILCTSGSAAANYTPAISESSLSHLPLVVLTSDRPHELRGIGAPQAINQTNMFANYVQYQFDFPIAEKNDNEDIMANTIKFQLQKASQFLYGPHRGPIHLNLPFREPLTPNTEKVEWLTSDTKILPHYQKTTSLNEISAMMKKRKGLIIVGDMQHQDVDQILTFSTIHDMPILADPLSQLRREHHPNVVTTYDLLLRSGLELEADFVIRVGKPVISKKLNQWLKVTEAFQILVQNNDRPDAFPITPHVSYEMSANDFFRQLSEMPTVERKQWLEKWQTVEKHAIVEIKDHLRTATDEAAYVGNVLDKLTKDDAIFVSNSMPIRDVDNLFIDCEAEVFANRGANGIDGVTSTALGMAVHKKITLLIGDLAFYHDMNGLLMSKLNDIQLNIVLLNNDGGGIFSYLPQKNEADAYFERLFGTPTGLNFEHTALLYDFAFDRFDTIEAFKYGDLSQFGSHIYEIMTHREDNKQQHLKLYKKLSDIIDVTL